MEYERIKVVLKRYDFGAKMYKCQECSKNIMSVHGLINTDELIQKPLPWELETFALFSVLSTGEYSNKKFDDRKGEREFLKIINSIKNYEHPMLNVSSGDEVFLDRFLIVTALTQFPIQEDIRYRLYRYSYIFNFENDKVNMIQQFTEKFGCNYKEFEEVGIIIQFLFSKELDRPIDSNIMEYIFRKYNHVIKHLIMDREEFVSHQTKITEDISQYRYGFNYFYQYPFIRYNKDVFLPLPHLIIHSVTSSLLSRLTKGNNELRSLFGKEVLENYLQHLSNLSGFFDEIKCEYDYNFKRNRRRTLDVMIRKGNNCLMMDSKSMSPKFGLRDFKEKDVEDTVKRMVESVKQVYRHITDRFQNEYYPFEVKMDFSNRNIFGAVIIYEDSYIRREIIMKKAAEELGVKLKSEEYKYLCSNVKLLSLYEIEKMMFQKADIFQALADNRDNSNMWFDYALTISPDKGGEKILREDVLSTIKDMQSIITDFAEELVEAGLITRR